MPKMYKESLVAEVDTSQISVMKKAGWVSQISHDAPEESTPEESAPEESAPEKVAPSNKKTKFGSRGVPVPPKTKAK